MSELSELFGAAAEDGAEMDFDAIFGGGAADAPPVPVEEPKTEAAEPPAETETVEAKTTEMPENNAPAEKKNTDKNKRKKPEAEPEPDLFSAFNQQEDEETPSEPAPVGQVSLFDKPAVFSYGGAKEPIEDASVTFEELRISKSEDFPELESGKSVSWRVKYGSVNLLQEKTALEAEIGELEGRRFAGTDLAGVNERLVELSGRYEELAKEAPETADTSELDAQLKELHRRLGERGAEQYAPKYAQPIADTTVKVKGVAARYKRELATLNGFSAGTVCPTCRRVVSEAELPAVKAELKKSVDALFAEGKNIKGQLDELTALEAKTEATFRQFQADDVTTMQTQIDNMESVDDLANVRPTGQIIMAKCVHGSPLSIRPAGQTRQMPQAA